MEDFGKIYLFSTLISEILRLAVDQAQANGYLWIDHLLRPLYLTNEKNFCIIITENKIRIIIIFIYINIIKYYFFILK